MGMKAICIAWRRRNIAIEAPIDLRDKGVHAAYNGCIQEGMRTTHCRGNW